ncbi:MAG: hypothetical protein HYV41_03995 [Candidatus Magasanikbacteria bacterium]|nr:hypothetical protein [Candidatus Magasanikbacteria bacterium]
MYRLYKLAKYKAVFAIAFALVAVGLLPQNAFAACTKDSDCTVKGEYCDATKNCVKGELDIFGTDNITAETKLGTSDLVATATQIINVALGLLGIVSVVIILIGGFKWMTAGGNDEQVGEARKWIFSGIIGLAIILSAWAIAKFVLNNLGTATGVKGFIEI